MSLLLHCRGHYTATVTVIILLLGFLLVLQEASQQRVAAFKAAAHLPQPVSIHKGKKTINLNASSRNVDMGLHATSAAAGHARSASSDTCPILVACRGCSLHACF